MSATVVDPNTLPTVMSDTLGALFIGVVVAGALWGVTCSQTFKYFRSYTEDPLYIKFLVVTIWALDTSHQALITHTAYTYLITHFSQLAFPDQMVNTLVIAMFFNSFVTLLVQSFFAHRVWGLSKKNFFPTDLVVAFILAEFVYVMIYAIRGVRCTTLAELGTLKTFSIPVSALAAAGDVLIASILCWMLHSSRAGIWSADTMITKLISFTVNTGLLTSFCAVASLVVITTLPNSFEYITFYFAISRLYCNSLLTMLNIRKAIRSVSGLDKYSIPATRNHLPINMNQASRSAENRTLHTDSPDTGNSNTGNTLIWCTIGCPERPLSTELKHMF